MSKIQASLACAVFLSGLSSGLAATYSDFSNDVFTGAGGGILDITSVDVNNTATDLIFKINLAGDPVATDWGKYMISFDTTPGGDTTGNAWNRPISMSSGMDYWVGSWVNSGSGAQLWQYSGLWSQPGTPTISKDSSSVTLQFAFSGLGLSVGNSFDFDVYTSGGGGTDGAVDALANPLQTINDWGVTYDSALKFSYTITPIPEPSTFALAGLGLSGLLILWRRR